MMKNDNRNQQPVIVAALTESFPMLIFGLDIAF